MKRSKRPTVQQTTEVLKMIAYRVSPSVSNDDLNALFGASWPNHAPEYFAPRLSRSLAYLCTYDGDRLVGFVNLSWDGGIHAFVLDPTVHPDYRRRGMGRGLVTRVIEVARERGIEWVHVDYEPHLRGFYAGYGFRPTEAGVIRLRR